MAVGPISSTEILICSGTFIIKFNTESKMAQKVGNIDLPISMSRTSRSCQETEGVMLTLT